MDWYMGNILMKSFSNCWQLWEGPGGLALSLYWIVLYWIVTQHLPLNKHIPCTHIRGYIYNAIFFRDGYTFVPSEL
jgi:hypothetical protein